MKKVLPVLVFVLLISLTGCDNQAATSSDQASREVTPGCVWKQYTADILDNQYQISFLMAEECTESYLQTELNVEDDNKITLRYKNIEGSSAFPIVGVYKMNGKNSEDIIKEDFISKLSAEEQEKCEIQPYENPYLNSKKHFGIVETEAYKKELEAVPGLSLDACGEYGLANGVYFEETADDILTFVSVGQDFPLFDEQSIKVILK